MNNDLLRRREIEARLFAALLEVLEERMGRAEALALLGEGIRREAVRAGRETARSLDRNDLEGLKTVAARWNEGEPWRSARCGTTRRPWPST